MMPENSNYKHFNDEEDRIYRKNIEMINSSIANGVKFDLACEFIETDDQGLRDLIIDDALKIEIAELHYGKGLSFLDVSKKLGVPIERLFKANEEMMDDILHTTREGSWGQPGDQGPLTR